MFERFTERARQVVVLAQEEARTFKHYGIGTEHVLIGLLREEEGLAARTLENLDITVEGVRAQIVRIVGPGEKSSDGQIPFTPRAKKCFELALREALSLGHNYIGTEHILLGLIRENDGVGMRILVELMGDGEPYQVGEKIRNEVVRMLSGPGGKKQIVESSDEVKITTERGAWVAEIGGVIKGEWARRPAYTMHSSGLVEITGAPGEPILLRIADTAIIIRKKV